MIKDKLYPGQIIWMDDVIVLEERGQKLIGLEPVLYEEMFDTYFDEDEEDFVT